MHRIAALIFALCSRALPAAAQDAYPSRTITLVVPYAPGGGSDFLGRILADGIKARLKETVVVQNIPGAGSAVGSMQVAKAKPDGYTLLLNHIGLSTVPTLYKKLELRSAGVVRVHRPVCRGADADHGALGLRAEDLRRAGGLRQGQQGEVHHGLRRHGQRDPSLRHAVPGGDRGAVHHRAVQGRGAGRGRRALGPGRRALRPADHDLEHDPLRRTARLRADRAAGASPRCPTCRPPPRSACRASISARGSASMRRSARRSRSSRR